MCAYQTLQFAVAVHDLLKWDAFYFFTVGIHTHMQVGGFHKWGGLLSYHQLSTVQSICLPGDIGNTGDTTSNCDTAVGGVGAVMNHVAVANSQLCSTHAHTDTHIRAYVHGYTTASCTRSTKADQLTVDLARRAHQSPGSLVDEDGLKGLPLAQRAGQGQSGVSFLVLELVRL